MVVLTYGAHLQSFPLLLCHCHRSYNTEQRAMNVFSINSALWTSCGRLSLARSTTDLQSIPVFIPYVRHIQG